MCDNEIKEKNERIFGKQGDLSKGVKIYNQTSF